MDEQIIYIRPEAPEKPPLGAPCNGCGICCLSEPCPLGIVLFRRKRGACLALQWSATRGSYRCGVLVDTAAVMSQSSPWLPAALVRWLAPLVARLAHRWIAAGIGCDSSLQAQSSRTMEAVQTSEHSKPTP